MQLLFDPRDLRVAEWLGFHQIDEEQWARDQVLELDSLMKLPGISIKVIGSLYHLDDGRTEFL